MSRITIYVYRVEGLSWPLGELAEKFPDIEGVPLHIVETDKHQPPGGNPFAAIKPEPPRYDAANDFAGATTPYNEEPYRRMTRDALDRVKPELARIYHEHREREEKQWQDETDVAREQARQVGLAQLERRQRGRPATGRTPQRTIRMDDETWQWCQGQGDASDYIRKLIDADKKNREK